MGPPDHGQRRSQGHPRHLVGDWPGLRAFRNPTFRFLAAGLVALGALVVHVLDVLGALHNWTSTSGATVTADFNSWMASGKTILAGGSPYLAFGAGSNSAFVAGAAHQPYPPTFFLLISPWVVAPDALRYLSWLAVEELALVALVLVVWAGLGRPTRTEVALALALVLPFLPVRQNLFEGQANILTGALAAFAVLMWQRRRAAAGGVALAVSIAFKPTIAFTALFLGYRRAWSILGITAAALGVLVAATLVAGWGHLWGPFLALLGPLGRGSGFIANQSVNGVLLRAWRPEIAGEPIGALPTGFVAAWYSAEAVLAIVVLGGLRRLRLPEPELAWAQFGVVSVLFGLLQPLSWFHHQAGAVVLVLVVLRMANRGYLQAPILGALLGCWALVSLVAYPFHVAARPYGGAGLYDQPWLRVGTSSAFLGLLVATILVSWAQTRPREAPGVNPS